MYTSNLFFLRIGQHSISTISIAAIQLKETHMKLMIETFFEEIFGLLITFTRFADIVFSSELLEDDEG